MKRLIATTALALIVAAPAFAAGTNAAADAKAETTPPAAASETAPPAATMPKTEPTLGEKAEKAADSAGTAIGNAADKTGAALNSAGEKVSSTVQGMTADEGWVDAETATVTSDELAGVDVYDASNDEIGEVVELVLADDGKMVKGAVIDVGGFLGLGEHRVMIPMADLKVMTKADDKDDFRVYIAATREQLEAMPEYES